MLLTKYFAKKYIKESAKAIFLKYYLIIWNNIFTDAVFE